MLQAGVARRSGDKFIQQVCYQEAFPEKRIAATVHEEDELAEIDGRSAAGDGERVDCGGGVGEVSVAFRKVDSDPVGFGDGDDGA